MNNIHDPETDKALQAAWKRTQDLRAPRSLDRKVLEAARKAPPTTTAGLPAAWFKPLAFAATLLLGVALLFEMQAPVEHSGDADKSYRELPGTSAEESALPHELEERSDRSPEAVEPGVILRATPEAARAARELKSESDRTRQQQKNAIATDANTLPALRDHEAGLNGARDSAAPLASQSRRLAPESSSCQTEQRVSADSWWACIEDLREAGRTQVAAAELAKLKDAFPDFAVPR